MKLKIMAKTQTCIRSVVASTKDALRWSLLRPLVFESGGVVGYEGAIQCKSSTVQRHGALLTGSGGADTFASPRASPLAAVWWMCEWF